MSRSSIMQNPFLIIRFVFLALLANLNILITTFAAWNVNTSVITSLPVNATAAVTLLSSCIILLCLTLALAGLVFPEAGSSKLVFEVSWSGVLAVIQTGTAIGATLQRPATTNWSLEASASLLVPISWLSSVFCMGYFMLLFASTMAHSRDYPAIWSSTVYSIDWFRKPQIPDTEKAEQASIVPSSESVNTEFVKDQEEQVTENIRPSWAPKIRRGIDEPFKRSLRVPPSAHSSTTIAVLAPDTYPENLAGSRSSVEKLRQSETPSRPSSPVQHVNHQLGRADSIPPRIESHDLPIPLPRLSEWVRADAIKGIDDVPRI